MARKPRIHYPGAVYHVILRGNAGQDLFFEDKDRHRFYRLLDDGQQKYGHRIHAFCLMRNHIHLALQVGEISLSRIMQNLGQRYTVWMNRRQGRTGHLFQGRYKAILLDADAYLLELVRYIHLNPVRAGIVKLPDGYAWSSHRVYLGQEKIPWLTTDWILAQFSEERRLARRRYQEFIMEGVGEGYRQEFHRGTEEGRLLGDDRFVEEVQKATRQEIVHKVTLEEILKSVCNLYGLDVQEVVEVGKRRDSSEARAMICWLVRQQRHLSLTDLSRRFNRDISALSVAASRLVEKANKESLLAARMAQLKANLF